MMQSFALLTSLIATAASVQAREPVRTSSKAAIALRADASRTAADSVRTVRAARRAQEQFESVRRANLPFGPGAPHGPCDLQVGRFCYWHDDGGPPPNIPPEPKRITEARARFLGTLANAARLLRGDEWVVGQQVRYLLEAGRTAAAIAAATDCQSAEWWCAALTGLALHQARNYSASDSAFAAALAAMPEKQRCDWTDVSFLVDGSAAKRYRALPCSERGAFERRFWWLSQPLYSVAGNDIRTEFYARRTMSRLEQQARSAYNLSWGSDIDELLMRFGWPTWWTRDFPSSTLASSTPSIVGHEPTPSFFFLPTDRLLDARPADARPDDWEPTRRLPPSRYAPAYAASFSPLAIQLSVFRRGDTALVVATYETPRDSLFDGGIGEAALAVGADETSPMTLVRQPVEGRTPAALVARAPWTPMLASVEVTAPQTGGVARARVGIRPNEHSRQSAGRLAASDILLYRAVDSAAGSFEEVVRHAVGTTRIPGGGRIGLYWELYGVRPTGESLSINLTVERVRAGWLTRAAESLGLAPKATPLRVRWQEVPERDSGIASRALTVDLSTLPAGGYRMQLVVTADDGSTAVSERFVDLFAPR